MYVRELRALYVVRRVPDLPLSPVSLRKTTDVAAIFTSLLGSEPVEVCGLLCLSTTFDVLTYHELSRGSLNGASAHPREVFKAALLANAASVMLGHNHPSGDPTPSAEDRALTRRLCEAGDILGIPLLDHVIVGNPGQYWSFREHDQLG